MSKPIDDYIAAQEPEFQARLRRLQEIIMEIEPTFEQRISYRMPTFRKGFNRLHFACYKKHIGIYPGFKAVEAFATELHEQNYKTSTGTIQFPHVRELDEALIRRIVQYTLEDSHW